MIDLSEWQAVKNSAILRRHAGDLDGAIAEMVKSISLTRPASTLTEQTATSLNYLADMYLEVGADGPAEEVLRESIELARPRYPNLLAANLLILGRMQLRQGKSRDALASAEESHRLYQREKHDYGVGQAEGLIHAIRTQLTQS